jgi:hypothetical protein
MTSTLLNLIIRTLFIAVNKKLHFMEIQIFSPATYDDQFRFTLPVCEWMRTVVWVSSNVWFKAHTKLCIKSIRIQIFFVLTEGSISRL